MICPAFLKNLDLFGAEVLKLNMRGEKNIKTPFGACISILISMLVFSYALVKLQHLLTNRNPLVTKYEEEDALDLVNVWSTSGNDFAMAFAVEHFEEGPKTDPHYLKWVVAHSIMVNGEFSETFYETHPCTDDDFGKFYEVEKRSQQKFDQLRGNFFCLDWESLDLKIHGSFRSDTSYSAIELLLLPCATRVKTSDDVTIGGDDICVWDQKEAATYMGDALSMKILHN